MINLKINNIDVQVSKGTSVLDAARQIGIEIPTMCYLKGLTNHPSCMICIVKDLKNNSLQPSCALPASNHMEIITDDEDIFNARQEALELLLSDHVGDCEAPCQPSCPANMNIPLMNRLIAEGKNDEALQVVKKDIALPLILGYISPAPCEKACRRTQVDNAVSICSLKKYVAGIDLNSNSPYFPDKGKSTNKKVAIIGTGPAGLACAFHILINGHKCVLFDKNAEAGGTLRYDIPDEKLPKSALDMEIEFILKYGAEFRLNTNITNDFLEKEIKKEFDAVVFATGNFEDSNLSEFGFESNKYGLSINKDTYVVDNSGIFACGNIIRSRRMAITSVAQGKATALSVHQYLSGEQIQKPHRMFNSKFGKLRDDEIDEYTKESTLDGRVELSGGKLDDFSQQQAKKEAARCMHCDCRKPTTCKLRLYADQYNADRRKFIFGDRKKVRKYIQHDLIIYEPEKCIRCNMCVEIASKEKDKFGFSSIGRGFNVEINMPLNSSISELLAGTAEKCAINCPTAAISLK